MPAANGTPARCSARYVGMPEPPPPITNTCGAPETAESSRLPNSALKLPFSMPYSADMYASEKMFSGVSQRSMRLCATHTTRSEIFSARSSSCSEAMTATLFLRTMVFRISKSSNLCFTSRNDVGSSSTMISGCCAIACTVSIAASTIARSSFERMPSRPVYG